MTLRDELAAWSAAFYAKGRPGYLSGLQDDLEVVAVPDGRLVTQPTSKAWGELLTSPERFGGTVVLWTVEDGGGVQPHSHSVDEVVRILCPGSSGSVWVDGVRREVDVDTPLVVPAFAVHEAKYRSPTPGGVVRVLIHYSHPGLNVRLLR